MSIANIECIINNLEFTMKNISILLIPLILLSSNSFAQNIYEVTPGTKGNEIMLTLANISEEKPATNLMIGPPQPLQRRGSNEMPITFHQSVQTIEALNPGEEKEVTFTFDINRNAPVNSKDTIEFIITSPDGIMMMKSFIFNYTPPKEFKLEQNFPNPFNPTTTIQYQLPKSARVTLKVYDILGSEVTTLVNEEQEAGYKEVKYNGVGYASGMYIYRLQAADYVSVKKMMMVK
jgi:hypothetical protein